VGDLICKVKCQNNSLEKCTLFCSYVVPSTLNATKQSKSLVEHHGKKMLSLSQLTFTQIP
jgi:hypothetical protein